MSQAIAFSLTLFCASMLVASPASDLSSPSPEIRAAAARILRATYKPPPETNWDWLLPELKVGDKMTNVHAILKAHGFGRFGEGGSQTIVTECRLDEAWELYCYSL